MTVVIPLAACRKQIHFGEIQMSNIHDMHIDTAVESYVVLPDGTVVPKGLHDELRRQVEAAIPNLRIGVTYRIQDLVGETFWSSLSAYTRRQLGKCLASWVARGEVGLRFVGCPRCNSKKYKL